MRLPHLRVRMLLIAVGVVALLIWGAMLASQSYDFYRREKEYGAQERGWREIASRNRRPEWNSFTRSASSTSRG
jgi:hypothetical protein